MDHEIERFVSYGISDRGISPLERVVAEVGDIPIAVGQRAGNGGRRVVGAGD